MPHFPGSDGQGAAIPGIRPRRWHGPRRADRLDPARAHAAEQVQELGIHHPRPRMLNRLSRTRSDVGRMARSLGVNSLLPFREPAIMRIKTIFLDVMGHARIQARCRIRMNRLHCNLPGGLPPKARALVSTTKQMKLSKRKRADHEINETNEKKSRCSTDQR